MKNTKKLISVLLAALMLLPGFSGLGLPAFAAAEEYDLWIEGTRVTSDNCGSIPVTGGTAAFEAATNTLTLNGATLASDSAEALIRAGSIDLTIDALGESRLVFSDKNGIEADGSLTVTSSSGSGTIAFEMNTGENAGSYDEVVCCADCREELSRKTVTVPALGHEDADNDGKCDRCGEKTHDFSAVLRSVVNIFQRLTKRAGSFIKDLFAIVLHYHVVLICG